MDSRLSARGSQILIAETNLDSAIEVQNSSGFPERKNSEDSPNPYQQLAVTRDMYQSLKITRDGGTNDFRFQDPSVVCKDTHRKLGEGNYGIVYKGTLSRKHSQIDVAIKTLKIPKETQKRDRAKEERRLKKDFKLEVDNLVKVQAEGGHRNVIRFWGYYSGAKVSLADLMIVIEFAKHGSLIGHLRKLKDTGLNVLSGMEMLQFAKQIALGMEFIEDVNLVHRDLAARNIVLVDGIDCEFECKITDFGLGRDVADDGEYLANSYYSKNRPTAWKWTSIEGLRGTFGIKGDVWSYGVVLFEVCSLGSIPWVGKEYTQDFIDDLEEGLRMKQGRHWSDFTHLYQLMLRCWEKQPEHRPDFAQIVRDLNMRKRAIISGHTGSSEVHDGVNAAANFSTAGAKQSATAGGYSGLQDGAVQYGGFPSDDGYHMPEQQNTRGSGPVPPTLPSDGYEVEQSVVNDGYEVDQTAANGGDDQVPTPMFEELRALPYYHGEVDRAHAEQSLKFHGLAPGVFLVRLKSPGYVISMCGGKSKVVHHKLATARGQALELNGVALGAHFTLVSEVINHLRRPQKHLKWATSLTTGVTSAEHLLRRAKAQSQSSKGAGCAQLQTLATRAGDGYEVEQTEGRLDVPGEVEQNDIDFVIPSMLPQRGSSSTLGAIQTRQQRQRHQPAAAANNDDDEVNQHDGNDTRFTPLTH